MYECLKTCLEIDLTSEMAMMKDISSLSPGSSQELGKHQFRGVTLSDLT